MRRLVPFALALGALLAVFLFGDGPDSDKRLVDPTGRLHFHPVVETSYGPGFKEAWVLAHNDVLETSVWLVWREADGLKYPKGDTP